MSRFLAFGLVRHEATAGRFGIFLATCLSVDATFDGPFSEHRRARRELTGLPGLGQFILVSAVLDEGPCWVDEIPEDEIGCLPGPNSVSQPHRDMCKPPPKTSW